MPNGGQRCSESLADLVEGAEFDAGVRNVVDLHAIAFLAFETSQS